MAARALTSVAFERITWIRDIEIHMDSANLASAAIPPKIGYRLDREVDRDVSAPGHTGHGFVWSTDRENWNASPRVV
jgi:RimJ/RimL family protein N-acetyltransferase